MMERRSASAASSPGTAASPVNSATGMAQIFGLRTRFFDPRLFARALGLETAQAGKGGAHFGGFTVQAAVGIDMLRDAWLN